MDAEVNSQPTNFCELSQFVLTPDDAYDTRCGEVYITLNRVLVFHCSLCDKKYGSFDYFLEHLTAIHYKNIQKEVIEIDSETEESESEKDAVLGDDEYDELSKDLVKPNIEEKYGEEDQGLKMVDADHFEIGFEEFTLEKIKEETTIEDQTSSSSSTKYDKEFGRNSKVYKCDKCGKMCVSWSKYKKHSIVHSEERKHKCKICGFAFKERSNLNSHLRRHSGQKKISCEMCPKKFFTRTEAATHQRTHTGERPYVCTYCGAAFLTSSFLNEHEKRHNNIRAHKCLHCDKRFYDTSQLKCHLVVHTNDRPFVCTECSASFPRRKALRLHKKLHINAKEYKCSLCEKSFNQRPALLGHVRTNHKVVDPI